MKKGLPAILIIVVLLIWGTLALGIKRTKTVDWELSFNEKSTKPYGLSVFYKELPTLFEDQPLKTVYHQPSSYLNANSESGYGDHDAKGNYIIIGNSNYLTEASIEKLLHFVAKGNHLFISSYHYPLLLQDTLHLDIDYELNPKKDSISILSFAQKESPSVLIDKNEADYFFSNLDHNTYEVLGYTETDEKRPNFIKVPFGEGALLLHTQPKAFTNYNILKDDRYTYVEHVMSYLPDDKYLYFDSFSKYQTAYNSDVEEESNLSWFLEQLAFRWAWYTALVFVILFMIFNAKRRQRIIKVIPPVENTSLAFVKTISNLYIEAEDYENLIDKKITYFLEKLRADYAIDTAHLDAAFLKKLTAKSGQKTEKIAPLIKYITWLRTKDEFSEENLITLNRFIDTFYSK